MGDAKGSFLPCPMARADAEGTEKSTQRVPGVVKAAILESPAVKVRKVVCQANWQKVGGEVQRD